jgi:hypothetical protein
VLSSPTTQQKKKNAWQRLEQSRRGLICNGCEAHVNLFMKDLFKLDYFNLVLEHDITLANFIKGRHSILDRFRLIQKRLKVPTERRRALALTV